MEPVKLDESYFVLPQITADVVRQLKDEGFDTIINNRPDNEEELQPSSAELASIAEELGLTYVYNPVNLSALTNVELDRQKASIANAEKCLSFCRTGTRSSVLWALINQDNQNMEAMLTELKIKGFDLGRCLPAMKPFIK